MMSNLFSIFDPSSSLFLSLNWVSVLYYFLFLPNIYWVIPSKYLILWWDLINFIIMEMKVTLIKPCNYFNMLVFVSLFLFLMMNNFISLFPYIFNSSSHLSFSLSISLVLWVSFMLFGWVKNMNYMFIHLTPQGTPYILMPFMVLIESVSNIIRPLTLSIRLSANVIAGHLLMTLISGTGNIMGVSMILLMILFQSFLVILEIAVSFIQAYVFSILGSLYSSETN